jgi:dihydroneopterin triphosphate diphosphatase
VTSPEPRIARECVEGYVFARPPLELLLLRRPPARGRIWVPVSGKVEPTDADLESALRRELREETGLTAPRHVEPLDWHVPFPASNGETWRLHAYAVEVDRPTPVALGDEHEAFAWLAPEEAIRRLHYPDNQDAVRRLLERLGAAREAFRPGGG